MSTRCQIAFYGDESVKKFSALLYIHSDGYPEGILPDLIPFLQDFNRGRGLRDIEYSAAWCLHTMMAAGEEAGCRKYLGYGISTCLHGDIEYLYKVYSTKLVVVKVRKVTSNTAVRGKTLIEIPLDKVMDCMTLDLLVEAIRTDEERAV